MWLKSFREPGKLNPPEAKTISSSCVRLAPGARVGEHVTRGKEELLFVLEGEAALIVGPLETRIRNGYAAYIPPETTHDVANLTGIPLTYVYVTARVDGPARG